jgi:hypothetical protein
MDPQQIKNYQTAGKCPFAFRDIPRFQRADLSDGVASGRPDVLIPDSRNADNAMVAQVTAFFHHLHNAVVTKLRSHGDTLPPTVAHDAPKGLHLFVHARRITTTLDQRSCAMTFCVICCAMRFGNTMHATLHTACGLMVGRRAARIFPRSVQVGTRNGPHVLCVQRRGTDGRRRSRRTEVAVIRSAYKFPPTKNRIADWSRFFMVGDKPPQSSRRIGPCYNDILLSERMVANLLVGSVPGEPPLPEDHHLLPARDFAGLLLSDLIRGLIGGPQTLDAMIMTLPPVVVALSPLLSDKSVRVGELRLWLEASPIVFTEKELERLSADPPLFLWLLFEAAFETNGQSIQVTQSKKQLETETGGLMQYGVPDFYFDAITDPDDFDRDEFFYSRIADYTIRGCR